LASTAREIMRECLPIKCVEAVFLAFYLTINMTDLVRIPIRFQSSVKNGSFVFKHIVMAVCQGKVWGALGLSRKKTLMYKDLKFDSLSSLLHNFQECYADIGHHVDHIGIGLPFGHNEHSSEPIHWRPLMIHFHASSPWSELTESIIETYVNKMDQIESHVCATGTLPEWFKKQFPSICPVVADGEDCDVDGDRFAGPGPGSPQKPRSYKRPLQRLAATASTVVPKSNAPTSNVKLGVTSSSSTTKSYGGGSQAKPNATQQRFTKESPPPKGGPRISQGEKEVTKPKPAPPSPRKLHLNKSNTTGKEASSPTKPSNCTSLSKQTSLALPSKRGAKKDTSDGEPVLPSLS